jgi:hypothetical protein
MSDDYTTDQGAIDNTGNVTGRTTKGKGYTPTATSYEDPRLVKAKEETGAGAPKRGDYPSSLGGEADYQKALKAYKLKKSGGAATQAGALASPAPSPSPR